MLVVIWFCIHDAWHGVLASWEVSDWIYSVNNSGGFEIRVFKGAC